MPANPKYLTTSTWQRFAKFSAGFAGGFLVTQAFHMLLVQWWTSANALVTLRFFGFVLWAGLLLLAFLSKNGWKIWGLYLLIAAGLGVLLYLT